MFSKSVLEILSNYFSRVFILVFFYLAHYLYRISASRKILIH